VSRLDIATNLCEPRIRAALEACGHTVTEFGQGMVSEETRRLLRHAHPPDLGRWPADFRVRTRSGLHCYVDAKYSMPGNRNVAIEMRSVLAARLQSVPWFYACASWDGRFPPAVMPTFSDYKSVNFASMPKDRACCDSCISIYRSSADPLETNARLPAYCPERRQHGGSGTPYFLVMADSFPYGDLLFDRQPWTPGPRGQDCECCYIPVRTAWIHCQKPGCAHRATSASRGDRTT
jgi:hypothetical protein